MDQKEKINIVIFGTGAVSEYFYKHIVWERVLVKSYIDTFNYGTEINGIPVYGEEMLWDLEFDYLVIACGAVSSVKERLIHTYGIKEDHLVCVLADDKNLQKELNEIVNSSLYKKMNYQILERITNIAIPQMFGTAMWYEKIKPEADAKDYVREQTLILLAKEIKRKGLKGAAAELGVYQGEFSKIIGDAFPDKKLYLFDTFEGFSEKDIKQDTNVKGRNTGYSFKQTKELLAVQKIRHPERVIVKKGYFPDSYDLGPEETFSFVSIDADLYQPIVSGLEIFYKSLEKGGYILVHDYGNQVYGGAGKAVEEFCDRKGISFFPLCDCWGSVAIMK